MMRLSPLCRLQIIIIDLGFETSHDIAHDEKVSPNAVEIVKEALVIKS